MVRYNKTGTYKVDRAYITRIAKRKLQSAGEKAVAVGEGYVKVSRTINRNFDFDAALGMKEQSRNYRDGLFGQLYDLGSYAEKKAEKI